MAVSLPGWKGFLFALCIVVASYQGVELVGITAGEARNPQVTLRRAINNILWRILIFYVGAIFVIVTIFPGMGLVQRVALRTDLRQNRNSGRGGYY